MADPERWIKVERGYLQVPPKRCPACARYWPKLGDRPTERFVGCDCTPERGHTLWACPACGAHAAEGCVDVTRWHIHTTPVGTPLEKRWTVRSRWED